MLLFVFRLQVNEKHSGEVFLRHLMRTDTGSSKAVAQFNFRRMMRERSQVDVEFLNDHLKRRLERETGIDTETVSVVSLPRSDKSLENCLQLLVQQNKLLIILRVGDSGNNKIARVTTDATWTGLFISSRLMKE